MVPSRLLGHHCPATAGRIQGRSPAAIAHAPPPWPRLTESALLRASRGSDARTRGAPPQARGPQPCPAGGGATGRGVRRGQIGPAPSPEAVYSSSPLRELAAAYSRSRQALTWSRRGRRHGSLRLGGASGDLRMSRSGPLGTGLRGTRARCRHMPATAPPTPGTVAVEACRHGRWRQSARRQTGLRAPPLRALFSRQRQGPLAARAGNAAGTSRGAFGESCGRSKRVAWCWSYSLARRISPKRSGGAGCPHWTWTCDGALRRTTSATSSVRS